MYKYSKLDLREDKSFYMYSEFKGFEFLEDYKKSRLNAIELIDSKICSSNSLPESIGNDDSGKIAIARQDEIDTFNTLKSCVLSFRTNDLQAEVAFTWCDIFTKKFEIAGKLKARYDKNLKPSDKNETCIESYVYLALLICYFIEKKGLNLRCLNALLKTNDLNVYNINHIENIEILKLLKEAIKKELGYIEKLIKKKICYAKNN